jgi:hypothetical protein
MPYKPTGRPPGRPKKTETRDDGSYANVFMGVGNRRDRSSFSTVSIPRYLSHMELENLYEGDGFARRIIDTPADEMIRAGFKIDGINDPDEVLAYLENLNALPALADAIRWADLYGGALAVLMVNDGGTLDDPLNPETVREIEGIRVYDRHQCSRLEKYTDPADKRYGETMRWMISHADGGMPYTVHESRVLLFDGATVPARTRARNDGWGNSRLQHCYTELVRLGMGYGWANALLERAQQAVHGIPGLSQLLRSKDGEQNVIKRIDLVDSARAINNTVVIDSGIGDQAGETYELKSTSFVGVTDIVGKFETALSAVSGMPKALLYGEQAAGLNAGDKVGLENWYASISQRQENELLHQLDKLVSLTMRALGVYTDDYLIKFCPLYVPSEKETAEVEYKKAQTRQIYVDTGALDPTELRKKLASEGGYPVDDMSVNRDEPGDVEEETT